MQKSTGLSWFDFLYFKYLKFYSGENYLSMEHMDMLTFMRGVEYSDIYQYMEEVQHEDLNKKNK